MKGRRNKLMYQMSQLSKDCSSLHRVDPSKQKSGKSHSTINVKKCFATLN